ncbi:MAG: hypothetical protein J7497_16135 [Chitinophagaceae bacterium]|nr:hypothetical protein [Chitinophagaceae bacterium]
MKYAFILITVALFSFKKTGSEIDYRKVFGNDYKWAVTWLAQNDKIISVYADKYAIPAKELKAIIFPELVRYNRVFDAIQIESLKYLYVSEGKQYADFSVGYFQMKPSFAENLERDADKTFGYGSRTDNEENRRQRLYRLTNTETQLNYLCAFYRLCEKNSLDNDLARFLRD